jgi:anti-sigma regulatory factor (Ser/Thr protein kinase)
MRTKVMHSEEPNADVRFCLVFQREAVSIPVMRKVLGDTLIRLGVDEGCVADLLLAVTEACTNVLRHAGSGRRYEIVAQVGADRCELEVFDSGRGIDPAKLPDAAKVVDPHRPCDPAAIAARRPPGRPPIRVSIRPPGRLRRRQSAPRFPPVLSAPIPLIGRFSRTRQAAEERAIAELPESGRGLAIMRACVDDVTLRSGPGAGTVVSLRKQIEWRSDAPLQHLADWQLRDVG